MAFVNGIACEELIGEFREGASSGGPFASKGYLCNWADRYPLANSFLGLATVSGGTSISFPAPTPYPESLNMYPNSVEIEGVGRPSQGAKQIQWPYAIVRVHYGVRQYGVFPADDPGGVNSIDQTMPLVYATQELDFASTWITIPKTSIKLADGTKLDQDFGMRVPQTDMSITLHKMPYLPGTLITNVMGSPINSAKFLNCPAGYCLFNGAKVRRSASTDGTFTQEVTYSFSFRAIAPWDYMFAPDGSGWKKVVTQGGADVISRGDLSVLFTYPYRY